MPILTALWFLTTAASIQGSPHYHVLLIGVPHPNCSVYLPLSGVSKDLACLAAVLENNWNVPASDVTIEMDPKNTTKQGIKDLIKTKLIDPCKGKDDVVYFGYAGHGDQAVDLTKLTKMSQAIVPSDARVLDVDKPEKGVKKGEVDPDSLLTGPEIGALFDGLKGKTDNVTLTFDSCHSGQITRGRYVARGATANPAR